MRILWVDDKHHELDGFKSELKSSFLDLELICVKSYHGALNEFEKYELAFDAIILDVQFLEKEDSRPGTEENKWFFKLRDRIKSSKVSQEVFTYSGQEDVEKNSLFKDANSDLIGKMFWKGKSEGDLIDAIDFVVQNSDLAKIRRENKIFIEMFDDKLIPKRGLNGFLKLTLMADNHAIDTKELRKSFESLLRGFSENGIVPNEIYDCQNHWVSLALSFIEGKEIEIPDKGNFRYKQPNIIPDVMAYSMRFIWKATSSLGHDDKGNGYQNRELVFLTKSIFYAYKEILCWYSFQAQFGKKLEWYSESTTKHQESVNFIAFVKKISDGEDGKKIKWIKWLKEGSEDEYHMDGFLAKRIKKLDKRTAIKVTKIEKNSIGVKIIEFKQW